jgi:23S rRNA (cytosine1962-C5)-methyltransferase
MIRSSNRNQNMPHRREGTVRIAAEVARRVRDGHPWIFKDALRGRTLNYPAGQPIDVVDPEGRFVARALVDSSESLALRVFSDLPGQVIDRKYFHHRLQSCIALRRNHLNESPLSSYRLVNGDSEGIPAIAVDRYGPFLILYMYSAIAESFLSPLVETLAELTAPQGIYLVRRYQLQAQGTPRPGAELTWGNPAPPEVLIAEGKARFVVDVTSPGSPGIFPDMRLGREMVAYLAGGRKVLNCFSYTGAFSVVAALHGAQSVVSIDSSSRAHTRARRNFSENNLDPERVGCKFVTGDAFAQVTRLAELGEQFGLVILDPPSFSSVRGKTFTTSKDYSELITAALSVTEKDGIICAATNTAKLPQAELVRAIGRGAQQAARRLIITHQLGQPPDYPVLPTFPEGAHLKFIVAQTIPA